MTDLPNTAAMYRFDTVSAVYGEGESPIPAECALAISYNDISYAVMMVSPEHAEDFIIGFSLTQGIIQSKAQIRNINVTFSQQQGMADVTLSPRAQWHLKARNRQLAGASGCGICGVEALNSALPVLAELPAAPLPEVYAFTNLRQRAEQFQQALKSSGAQHAAFFIANDGTVIECREDIGRHNALDKLIGALAQNNTDLRTGFALLTSRCGIELVQKAIKAGIPTLVTLSAPTTLAVDWARRYRLNLIHLPHQSEPRVYSNSHNT